MEDLQKLSMMEPLHAHWLFGLYYNMRNNPGMKNEHADESFSIVRLELAALSTIPLSIHFSFACLLIITGNVFV